MKATIASEKCCNLLEVAKMALVAGKLPPPPLPMPPPILKVILEKHE
jgi:hypothetical protein